MNVTSPEKLGNVSAAAAAAGSDFETVANLRLAAESAQFNQQQQRAAQQLLLQQNNITQTEVASSAYQDDFLDMHCDDMDMF